MSERQEDSTGGDDACLRRTLGEIEEQVAELAATDGARPGGGELGEDLDGVLAELTARLGAVEEELHRALGVLAESRSDLRQLADQRLPDTQEKLAEASSATEVAASRMLDRLERALELVSELERSADAGEAEGEPERGPGAGRTLSGATAVRDELEEELHEVINSLQFQDITSQQIRHVSSVLRDTERRLGSLASILFGDERAPGSAGETDVTGEDEDGAGTGPGHAVAGDASFDPDATTDGASDRQDVADEVFG